MSTRHRRRAFPRLRHGWQRLPLSPFPQSSLRVNPYRYPVLNPVKRPITRVPLVLLPLLGTPDCCARRSLCSHAIHPRGEKLEISLSSTPSHFRLVNPASGDIFDMWLSRTFKRSNPVNLASGDMSGYAVVDKIQPFQTRQACQWR